MRTLDASADCDDSVAMMVTSANPFPAAFRLDDTTPETLDLSFGKHERTIP